MLSLENNGDISVSAIAVLFASTIGISFWLSFGFARWGARVWSSLLALVPLWYFLLKTVNVAHLDYLSTGTDRLTATVELFCLVGFCQLGFYFIGWLDNRLIDQYSPTHLWQLSNAEFNLQDLLITTVALALLMTVASTHVFYAPQFSEMTQPILRAGVLCITALSLLWAILSTSRLKYRVGIAALMIPAAHWLSHHLDFAGRSNFWISTPELILLTYACVGFISLILNLCGFRLVIPPLKVCHDKGT